MPCRLLVEAAIATRRAPSGEKDSLLTSKGGSWTGKGRFKVREGDEEGRDILICWIKPDASRDGAATRPVADDHATREHLRTLIRLDGVKLLIMLSLQSVSSGQSILFIIPSPSLAFVHSI